MQARGIFIGTERWMKLPSETGWKQMPINNSLASLPSASYPAGNLELARVASLDREISNSTRRATHYEHTCSWTMIMEAFCREDGVSLSTGSPFWPQVVSRWVERRRTPAPTLQGSPGYPLNPSLCDITLRGTWTAPLGDLCSSKFHKGLLEVSHGIIPSAHEGKGVPPWGVEQQSSQQGLWKGGLQWAQGLQVGNEGFNHSCSPKKRFLHSEK